MREPPAFSKSLTQWANDLVAWLKELVSQVETPGPKIVQLQIKTTTASASESGILMYSPDIGKVVVTINGDWYALEINPVNVNSSGIVDN